MTMAKKDASNTTSDKLELISRCFNSSKHRIINAAKTIRPVPLPPIINSNAHIKHIDNDVLVIILL